MRRAESTLGGGHRTAATLFGITVALCLPAGALEAQACLGFPQGSGSALQGTLRFPERAKSYEMSGITSTEDAPFYLTGSFTLVSPDLPGLKNEKSAGGGLTFEIAPLTPNASLCPTVTANHAWIGDLRRWSIPFGIGVGTSVPLNRSGAIGLTPYAIPEFTFVQTSLFDFKERETSFGLTAGVTVNFSRFIVGGSMNKIFERGTGAILAIRMGAVWP